jgi:hypothetical protein
MRVHKLQPVETFENLRSRVDRFFRSPAGPRPDTHTLALHFLREDEQAASVEYPGTSVTAFVNFLSDALPQGDVYLFGGILRDLALLGRRGFSSDIDLVVEGDWRHCVGYLESLGARQNKFGGYRFEVAGWPIDVWNAQETWAIKQGFVSYRGIGSLTETTILNWDAILMNWRTRRFVHRRNYLEELRGRVLDIVLEPNPNPLGMVTRVLRHLCAKDARQVSPRAANYLAKSTETYTFPMIKNDELRSYGESIIDPEVYRLFEHFKDADGADIGHRFNMASEALKRELGLV